MADFLEKLRINNIFPQGEGLYEDRPPFGLPDFNMGDRGSIGRIGRRSNIQANPTRPPRRNWSTWRDLLPKKPMNVEYRESPIGMAGSNIYARSEARSAARDSPEFQQELELARVKEGTKQRDLDIKQQRANVYEFKARNPNLRILTPKGGNIVAVDPTTGETLDLGVPTGSMSEQDLQELKGTQSMEQIGARTEGQKEVQRMRGEQQKEMQGMRGEQQKQAIQERNKGRVTQNKEQNPAQVKTQQLLSARELIGNNPNLEQFVRFNPDGTVSIVGEPDLVSLSQLRRGIYGTTPTDIELTPEGTQIGTTVTPQGTTNVTMPARTTSKYKVTVQ